MVFRALALVLLLCPAAGAAEAMLAHPFSALAPSTCTIMCAVPGMVNGETLEYEIYWGVVHVGTSFLRIDGAVNISSRTAWHLVSEARSGPFINKFYKVDDRNESWMDAADLRSYGYYKKVSEGKYFVNEWAVFDWRAGKFYGKKMSRNHAVSDFEGALAKPVNDMLSAVYRVRALKLAPGEKIQMEVNTKRNWALTIKAGKRETVETAYGRKKCIPLEPMVGEDGLFVAKAGRRMLIWVTDDELKLPLILKAEISIGSITAKLVRRTIPPEITVPAK